MSCSSTNKVVFIMGVSGCGKSSVGKLLAEQLSFLFIDADDHHPSSNIEKMSQGEPLTDHDRAPWLKKINKIAYQHRESGVVIACSALKRQYRKQLNQSIENDVCWVYLKGSYELIFNRIKNRQGHFMNTNMLESQFDALDEPEGALTVSIDAPLDSIVEKIKSQLF